MEPVPVEIAAMWWVDVARGACFCWWLGEPKPDGCDSLRPDFQVAECWVDRVRVVIFHAYPPRPPEQQATALRALREQFGPDTLISLVDEYDTGWSRQSALSPAGGDEARIRVAMAVAVVHASWGWDETVEIRVEDQAGVVLACPRRTASGWTARARLRE